MKLGMIGLGRMGRNMALRMKRAGHDLAGTDRSAETLAETEKLGIRTFGTAGELVRGLETPRVLWAMIPAGTPVDDLIDQVLPLMQRGDLLVDGGNSNWRDSKRRGARLAQEG